MSWSEKLQQGYNHLMDNALFGLKQAEDASLHWLGEQITRLEYKGDELEVLTEHELEQVQNLVKADIEQTAGYFNELGQGIEAFIENDWPLIETMLNDKLQLAADPSQIELLKMRLQAALNQD